MARVRATHGAYLPHRALPKRQRAFDPSEHREHCVTVWAAVHPKDIGALRVGLEVVGEQQAVAQVLGKLNGGGKTGGE